MSSPRRKHVFTFLSLAAWLLLFATDAFGRAGGGGGYHGGGGGHSSGGSGGHGGSGHGGGGGSIFMILWMVTHPVASLIIIAIVYVLYKYGTRGASGASTTTAGVSERGAGDAEQAMNALRAHDPDFNEAQFLGRVGIAFNKIQAAWCAQDLRTVRPFISDGVHERFSLQFAEQKAEGYRDHMENIRLDNSEIVMLSSPGLFDEVSVRIDAAARDWRESLLDGSRLEGSQSVEPFVEIWTFLRRRGAKTEQNKPGLIEGNCPNCGAPIEMNQSSNCASCNALLRSGTFDWVLAEITQFSEWHARGTEVLPGVAALRDRDPDFDVAALEDRASVIYWRKATTDRTAKPDALRKVALPQFVEMYSPWLRPTPGVPRQFIADTAVGSVDTLGVFSDGGWDRALVEIKWSGHWFVAESDGRIRNTGRETWAATLYVLARQTTAKTDPGRSISSAHCPNCGAPESTGASNACESCGTILNDGSASWVLEDVRDKNDPAAGEWFRRMQAGEP